MNRVVAPNRKFIVAWLLRVGLCAIFAYAGYEKWSDSRLFVEQIANYQFMPQLAPWAALLFPPVELVAALGILALPQVWRRGSALVMFVLLLMFTLAMARAWSLGINIECGCFGKGSPTIGPWSFLRNTGLMLAALTYMLVDRPANT